MVPKVFEPFKFYCKSVLCNSPLKWVFLSQNDPVRSRSVLKDGQSSCLTPSQESQAQIFILGLQEIQENLSELHNGSSILLKKCLLDFCFQNAGENLDRSTCTSLR